MVFVGFYPELRFNIDLIIIIFHLQWVALCFFLFTRKTFRRNARSWSTKSLRSGRRSATQLLCDIHGVRRSEPIQWLGGSDLHGKEPWFPVTIFQKPNPSLWRFAVTCGEEIQQEKIYMASSFTATVVHIPASVNSLTIYPWLSMYLHITLRTTLRAPAFNGAAIEFF